MQAIRRQLLTTTFICSALAAATAAQAQDQKQDTQPQSGPVEASNPNVSANADTQAADQGAIVITGSRIPQPNLTSVSPVTVLNSQEIRLSGATRAEDLVNSLPQAFAAQSGNISNGSTGTATINLRNLGPQPHPGADQRPPSRPGRSQLVGSPTSTAIPATLIERVDVLTGGASSVYGADAVAGVVNFIMNTNFEGIRLDGQYSFFKHDNRLSDSSFMGQALERARLRLPARSGRRRRHGRPFAARSAPRSTTAAAMSSPTAPIASSIRLPRTSATTAPASPRPRTRYQRHPRSAAAR